MNKKQLKVLGALLIFCVSYLFSVDTSSISQAVFGAEAVSALEGINGARLGSKRGFLSDSTFLSAQNSGKNTFYSLNHITTNVFNDLGKNPSNIFVGYYYDEMQSIQYIYNDDVQIFDDLESSLEKEFKTKGKLVRNLSETYKTTKTWCDSKDGVYIALYKMQLSNENKTVLAIASKKLTNEQLNLDTKAGIPASVCYRH